MLDRVGKVIREHDIRSSSGEQLTERPGQMNKSNKSGKIMLKIFLWRIGGKTRYREAPLRTENFGLIKKLQWLSKQLGILKTAYGRKQIIECGHHMSLIYFGVFTPAGLQF